MEKKFEKTSKFGPIGKLILFFIRRRQLCSAKAGASVDTATPSMNQNLLSISKEEVATPTHPRTREWRIKNAAKKRRRMLGDTPPNVTDLARPARIGGCNDDC